MKSISGISLSLALILVQFSSLLLLQFGTASASTTNAFDPACPWMDTSLSADARANLLLAASTLDQKLRWLDEQAAANPTQTTFRDVTYPVQVPCTPVIQYTDGPESVTGTTGVTAFPSQTALAATWDTTISRQKGQAQAEEAFDKHRNVLLGPGLSSGRTPLLGRTAEYMGEDSLLGGTLAGTMVQGIQEGNPDKPVMATLKHWVDNEQELDRQTSSSNVDARTQHEIYNLPFEIAIKTGNPGSVMCSYNQINGIYSCENPTTLTQYLKNEIGFKGYVMSDFGAVHSTAPSLNAGLDQELNRPRFYSPANIKAALDAGQITEAVIDQAAFRVVRAYIAAGLFDHPHTAVAAAEVSTPEHQAVARKVAKAGAVLLAGPLLPVIRLSPVS
jgi:beta-glucosidase